MICLEVVDFVVDGLLFLDFYCLNWSAESSVYLWLVCDVNL